MTSGRPVEQLWWRYRIWLLGLVMLLTAGGNYWLAGELAEHRFAMLLSGFALAQWCLLAVLCGLGGRNWISGLLLAFALSPLAAGTFVLGSWQADPQQLKNCVLLCWFPAILPISAIPCYFVRIAWGWRIERDVAPDSRKIKLADIFSLIAMVAYAIVLARLPWLLVESSRLPFLAATAWVALVVPVCLMVILSTLWWLARLQDRPQSAVLFLTSLALFPSLLMVFELLRDPASIGNSQEDLGILAMLPLAFAYFYGCLLLMWLLGCRLRKRPRSKNEASGENVHAAPRWERWAMVWLMTIAVVVGAWSGRVEYVQRRAKALPALLKRTKAGGGKINGKPMLRFSENLVTDRDLRYLAADDSLYALWLARNPITDRGLRHLRHLPNLGRLWLDETKITDRAFPILAELPALESLYLSRTAITDAGLGQFKSPEKLIDLDLSHCRVGDATCEALAGFRNLKHLRLKDTAVRDVGMSHLSALPELASLTLDSTSVTDDGLRRLGTLSRLAYLGIENTQVTGVGFASWEQPNAANMVNAKGSAFNDDGLAQVARLSNLELLLLNRTQVTDAGLRNLATHPSLLRLHLEGTAITDEGVRHLASLPKLGDLGLTNTLVTGEGFRGWPQPHTLYQVNLSNTLLTDDACRHLAGIDSLKELWIDNTSVTNEGLMRFAKCGLKRLSARGTGVTGKVLLDSGFASLESLWVDRGQCSDEEVAALKASGTLHIRVTPGR